ncbi:MAG: redoxin domain-containing protein [Chitinivibrionales bacterium]|nr:redoxin domain-containing protein [Chitinivibrionales bacterium]
MCGKINRIIMQSWIFILPLVASISFGEDTKLLEAGTQAPSFSLPSLGGKREVLSVWCGRMSKPYINNKPHIVILSFWATWCKPCRKEIPELMKFAKNHAGESVKIFLINIDKEGAANAGPFVKEQKYTLPVLLDPYKRTSERYGVKSLPALFVIGPEGKIRYSSTGYDDDQSLIDKMEDVVTRIREGKEVEKETVANEGESVPVGDDESADTAILPRDKWNAVARKECGDDPEEIAAELGVGVEELKIWYQELKNAALSVWSNKKNK